MTTMQQNRFQDVVQQIQNKPQNQRAKTLIEAIAQVMQQSRNSEVQQWGEELSSIEPQLLQAIQQN